MRKIAIVGALGALLTGCAGVYDEGQLASANASKGLAMDRCAHVAGNSPIAECIIEAERQYAVTIKLTRMDLFDAFAARLRLAVADREAGKIDGKGMLARYDAITNDYYNGVRLAAEVDARKRAQIAAGLAAVGAAAEREADRQAIQNAANRPVNCTSTRFGNQVQTTCN